METVKPFDVLNNSKGNEVTVALKNGEMYKGKLKAFDMHLNLVIFEAVQIKDGLEEQSANLIIRGDTITTIKGL